MDTAKPPKSRTLSQRVAAEIRAEMGRQEINNAALAELLGVSEMWVSRKKRGLTPLTLPEVEQIAEVLEVPVAALLGVKPDGAESGNMSPSSLMAGRTTTTLTSRPTRGRYAPHVSGIPVQGHEPAWACEPVTS